MYTTLPSLIAQRVAAAGSLRAYADIVGVDHTYLHALATGKKSSPSQDVLNKLGIEKIVEYRNTFTATPLTLRSKSG